MGEEAYQQERIKQKKQKNKETVKKESCEAEFVLSLAHFSLFLLIPIMSFDPNANLFLILMIFFWSRSPLITYIHIHFLHSLWLTKATNLTQSCSKRSKNDSKAHQINKKNINMYQSGSLHHSLAPSPYIYS